jgi:hypothetical protein
MSAGARCPRLADVERKAGHRSAAWNWRQRSLMTRYWWRYLVYTRWLL